MFHGVADGIFRRICEPDHSCLDSHIHLAVAGKSLMLYVSVWAAATGFHLSISPLHRLANAASKAICEGSKFIFLTNSSASFAPCSRSMPQSSHSTDRGPLYPI